MRAALAGRQASLSEGAAMDQLLSGSLMLLLRVVKGMSSKQVG